MFENACNRDSLDSDFVVFANRSVQRT